MLLALDIGNSNIVIGVSSDGEWTHQWRIQTDDSKTVDEYAVLFQSLFSEVELSYRQFDEIIICSVVPQLTQVISQIFEERSPVSAVILNGQINTGIAIKTTSPESVGADIIAGAAGAYEMFNDDSIIVDFEGF